MDAHADLSLSRKLVEPSLIGIDTRILHCFRRNFFVKGKIRLWHHASQNTITARLIWVYAGRIVYHVMTGPKWYIARLAIPRFSIVLDTIHIFFLREENTLTSGILISAIVVYLQNTFTWSEFLLGAKCTESTRFYHKRN